MLTLAAALHLGAAVFLIRAGGGTPHGAGTVRAPVAMVWLVPSAAPEAPRAATPPQPVRAAPRPVAIKPAPPPVAPEPAPPAPTASIDTPALLPAQAEEPRYAIARRSIAFGGTSAGRDTASNNTAPSRPLAAWLQEGVARSVGPVAQTLAAAGDGTCIATRSDPHLVCAPEILAAAAVDLAPEAQRALLSWLQSGLVGTIEIRIENGTATYAAR